MWSPAGIIDFGDSLGGDPLYDMLTLYVSTLRSDSIRFSSFLREYLSARSWAVGGAEAGALLSRLPYRMMCYALLCPVNVLGIASGFRPGLLTAHTLAEVAEALFAVEL